MLLNINQLFVGQKFAKIMTENSTVPSISENNKEAFRASIKKEAKNLTWSNVNYAVGDKTILKDCWGEVRAILAIITTSLD